MSRASPSPRPISDSLTPFTKSILGNELSLITTRGETTLSEEQTAILEDIEKLDLTNDNSGQLGSGKIVLGLEIGRMILNKRQLLLPVKKVSLTFDATKSEEKLGHIGVHPQCRLA